jgi:acyl-CoA synthetase (NDP forming)
VHDHPLQPLLAPRSIAFVGASNRTNTPGHDMMRAIRRSGFAGNVHAVNPRYGEIEGYPCVANLAALPSPPDLVVLSVKNELLEGTLDEAIAARARAAVIFASGILAQDSDPPLSARLAAKARSARMPICGGNCMGYYNELDHVWICGFPSPRTPGPGTIAFVAHSGSVFGALSHNDPRLRFALAISPGQELTTTVADYLAYAVERPEVKVCGLFIETARDPDGFRRALAKAAERNVAVVALKTGRTEAAARAALTHTGALAGNDAAFDALFDRYGVVRVDTLDELAATLLLLSTGRRAANGGLVAIHDSGGEREMIIDQAEALGVPFANIAPATISSIAGRLDPGLAAENPLDAWGTGRDFVGQFEGCFRSLVDDPSAALGLFVADIRDGSYLYEGFATAARAVAAGTDKPVAMATNYTQVRHDKLASSLTDAGVPVLDGTHNALVAVRAALSIRDFRARASDPPPPAPSTGLAWRGRLSRGDQLDESAALDLVSDWGIPTPRRTIVADEAGAVAAARAMGFPVVAKTAMPEIHHKTEAGGVKLGLNSEPDVASAYRDLSERLGPRVAICSMASRGVELSLGVVRDAQFGPMVVVGAGGVLVELLADRVTALAPFGPDTARRLLDRLKVRRLLDGFRGAPPTNLEELANLISRFSVMASELGDLIAEMDVNPLICGPAIVAVDALIKTSGESDHGPHASR